MSSGVPRVVCIQCGELFEAPNGYPIADSLVCSSECFDAVMNRKDRDYPGLRLEEAVAKIRNESIDWRRLLNEAKSSDVEYSFCVGDSPDVPWCSERFGSRESALAAARKDNPDETVCTAKLRRVESQDLIRAAQEPHADYIIERIADYLFLNFGDRVADDFKNAVECGGAQQLQVAVSAAIATWAGLTAPRLCSCLPFDVHRHEPVVKESDESS